MARDERANERLGAIAAELSVFASELAAIRQRVVAYLEMAAADELHDSVDFDAPRSKSRHAHRRSIYKHRVRRAARAVGAPQVITWASHEVASMDVDVMGPIRRAQTAGTRDELVVDILGQLLQSLTGPSGPEPRRYARMLAEALVARADDSDPAPDLQSGLNATTTAGSLDALGHPITDSGRANSPLGRSRSETQPLTSRVNVWTADYGDDGQLIWDGHQAAGQGRVWQAFLDWDATTPPGSLEGVGGGFPRFPWGEDGAVDLMVFTGNYLPSRADIRVAFTGEFQPVKDRVFPGTPKGAVR